MKLSKKYKKRLQELALGDNAGGYWGSEAAGALVVCEETGKFLFPKRATRRENGTWATWGGAVDMDDTPEETVEKEFEEEAGYTGPINKLIPLYVFHDADAEFRYFNFLAVIPKEFTPSLNWENSEARWFNLVASNGTFKLVGEDGREDTGPLHPGVEKLFNDKNSFDIISNYASRVVAEQKLRKIIRKILQEAAIGSHARDRIKERVYGITDVESKAFEVVAEMGGDVQKAKDFVKSEIIKQTMNKINYVLSKKSPSGAVVGINLGKIKILAKDKKYGLRINVDKINNGNVYYVIVRVDTLTTVILYDENAAGQLTHDKLKELVERHENARGGALPVISISKNSELKYMFADASNENVIDVNKFLNNNI